MQPLYANDSNHELDYEEARGVLEGGGILYLNSPDDRHKEPEVVRFFLNESKTNVIEEVVVGGDTDNSRTESLEADTVDFLDSYYY